MDTPPSLPPAGALLARLARLDTPAACACPLDFDAETGRLAPCAHGPGPDHPLTLAEWATLLRAAAPAEYAEPPPPAPDVAVSAGARVAIYAARHAAGLALFCRRDSWSRFNADAEESSRVGVEAVRLRNGATDQGGLRRG